MILVLLSTPTWAFMPKYQALPFLVWCISGSRCCSRFFVDEGACRMVASTIVPVVMRTPWACKCRFTVPRICSPSLMFLQQVAKLTSRGFVGHRFMAQINAHELPHHRRVVQRLFHCRVRQVEPLLQKINPQHPLHSYRRTSISRLGIVWLNQRAQLAPRDHPFHFFQKYLSSRLFCVPLKTIHRRQSPLLFIRQSHLAQLTLYSCGKGDLIQSLPSSLRKSATRPRLFLSMPLLPRQRCPAKTVPVWR